MEDSDDDNDDDYDEGRLPWTVMNSRLELPCHLAHERRDGHQQRRSGSSLSSFFPTRPTSWPALLTPSSSSSRRPMNLHAKTPSSSTCSSSTTSGGDYFHYQNVREDL